MPSRFLKPTRPREKYFRQFAEAGTDVFCFSTNLGFGFSAPLWVGPNQWDFSTLDKLARRVLDVHPNGLLLPRVYLTTLSGGPTPILRNVKRWRTGESIIAKGPVMAAILKCFLPRVGQVAFRNGRRAEACHPAHAGIRLWGAFVRVYDYRADERGMVSLEHSHRRIKRLQRPCPPRLS